MMTQMTLWATEHIDGDAVIDGPYRYVLRRWWGEDERILLWILLNPSTADGRSNDPTLLRVLGFTHREGYSRLEIVNLYAWRSPDSKGLRQVQNPIGPQNDVYIRQAAQRAQSIIVGWGNRSFGQRDREVLDLLAGRSLWAFGTTQQNQPRHPLYLKRGEVLTPFS